MDLKKEGVKRQRLDNLKRIILEVVGKNAFQTMTGQNMEKRINQDHPHRFTNNEYDKATEELTGERKLYFSHIQGQYSINPLPIVSPRTFGDDTLDERFGLLDGELTEK